MAVLPCDLHGSIAHGRAKDIRVHAREGHSGPRAQKRAAEREADGAVRTETKRAGTRAPARRPCSAPNYPAAFTMSKIGRYIAITMPPTTTPRNTIMTGSISAS